MIHKLLTTTLILLTASNFCSGQLYSTDSVTIILKVINNEREGSLFLSYTSDNQNFNRQGGERIVFSKSFIRTFRIRAETPLIFDMYDPFMGMAKGVIYPGDSIGVTFDFSKNRDSTIAFNGKSASACRYYSSLLRKCPSMYNFNLAEATMDNHLRFFNGIDENLQCRRKYFERYRSEEQLPEWFSAYEEINLLYEKPSQMLKVIHEINERNTRKIYANPEFLLWFRDIPVDNPKALQNSIYFDFLWQYFLWKSKIFRTKNSPQEVKVAWLYKMLPDIELELKNKTREWFLTRIIINFYAVGDIQLVDSVLVTIKPKITDPQYLNLINTEREIAVERRKIRFANAAKVGSKAPDFYLKDSLNKVYSIEKFKGKWVLLSFYNGNISSGDSTLFQMQQILTLNTDKLAVLNIYNDTEVLKWKKIITTYPGSGTHLFSKGKWGEILMNSYGLESFPYFVLVDPDGIIRYSKANDYTEAITLLNNL